MSVSDNFFDLEEQYSDYEKSRIAILRVPYERSTSYERGTANAPDAIMKASQQVELYDIETGSEPYKMGIHTAKLLNFNDNQEPEVSLDSIENEVSRLIDDGKFPVIIGGEHTITLGSYRAFHRKYDELTCVSLDAHSDLRDSYQGSKYSHACVMRRISELSKPILIGIRSMDKREMDFKMDNGITILYADEIINNPGIIESLKDQMGARVYLSIDMDVFDPSYVPGVGTPEPGGLDWFQILDIIKALNTWAEIVGFDIVELLPSTNQVRSDFLAAKLLYKILSYHFSSKQFVTK